jgi:hypothetical protein
MAYLEDQTASTVVSVVNQISAFAVANAGFTALPDVVIAGDSTTNLKILLKDGMYYYIYADTATIFTKFVGRIKFRMMRVEPTALNYFQTTSIDAQLYPAFMTMWENTEGAYSGLNLYTDGNAVNVVLEVYDNVFAHASFGKVDKMATWTGGEYTMSNSINYWTSNNGYSFTNTTYASYIFDGSQATFNERDKYGMPCLYRPFPSGASGDWQDYPTIASQSLNVTTQRAFSSGYSTSNTTSINNALFNISPNDTSLRSVLFPLYMFVNFEGTTGSYHLQGHIPSAKYLNIRDISPKEIVDVKWRVYPYCSKFGDVFSAPVSGNYGLAYDRS